MKTISLCMIVKDEESTLARCLESVCGLADEIIIADTGSSDKTTEIAEKYTDNIFSFEWADDFSKARNFSFSKATYEYIMWLDADDVILARDRQKLIDWKISDDRPDILMLPYHAAIDSDGAPSLTYYRERILRRDRAFKWYGAVHEAISPCGRAVYLDAAVTHMKKVHTPSDRNLKIYEALLAKGEPMSLRDTYYYARELFFHSCFSQAAELFENVINSTDAWLENRIDSCRMLSKCRINLNRRDAALTALLGSFSLAPPRAEVCCDIGEIFMENGDFKNAVFWYRLATTLPKNAETGAFISPDCYDFLPYLQLCVCYDRLGDIPNARLYHQKASACKPSHPSVVHNCEYFSKL